MDLGFIRGLLVLVSLKDVARSRIVEAVQRPEPEEMRDVRRAGSRKPCRLMKREAPSQEGKSTIIVKQKLAKPHNRTHGPPDQAFKLIKAQLSRDVVLVCLIRSTSDGVTASPIVM